MGSIIRVESCHDLSVQEVGSNFMNFMVIFRYLYAQQNWHTSIIIGPLLEGEWLAHLYKFLETTLHCLTGVPETYYSDYIKRNSSFHKCVKQLRMVYTVKRLGCI